MPNEVKDLGDGNMEVTLETGEKFTGNALEVTNAMATAHVNTKRWGQSQKTEAENLKAEVNRLNTPPPPPTTPADQEQANLQRYMLDTVAKAEGFANADERMAAMRRMIGATEMMESQRVVGEFINRRPEYPNTPEANDALEKYITENKWDFSVQSLMAASDTLIRDGKINALTGDEQNAAWSRNLQASNTSGDSGRPKPPPMLPSGTTNGGGTETWEQKAAKMSLDELRASVLKTGQQSAGR